MNWDDLQYKKTPYRKGGLECYGQSKLAQILMTVELADRLKGKDKFQERHFHVLTDWINEKNEDELVLEEQVDFLTFRR